MTPTKEIYFQIAEELADQGTGAYEDLDSLGTLDLISALEDHYHVSIPMWDHKPPLEELVAFIRANGEPSAGEVNERI